MFDRLASLKPALFARYRLYVVLCAAIVLVCTVVVTLSYILCGNA